MTIRVLVVDDSVVIRRLLADIIDSEPDMSVVSTASNGKLALEKISRLNPDVITLDIEMPVLDGNEVLRELRRTNVRIPTIMFSTLTERGAKATLDAMALGASDYVSKPSNTGGFDASKMRVREELLPKIRGLVGPKRLSAATTVVPPPLGAGMFSRCIAIGCSTGGPNALAELLPQIPGDVAVPIVVTQHMPPVFTGLLAKRLNGASSLEVVEAENGMKLEAGTVYIAPGDFHLGVSGSALDARVVLDQNPPVNSCRPAVDPMFRSLAALYGDSLLAVVLTGMGQDGVAGAEAVRSAGGQVFVQDAASSVVWGMPGAIHDAGHADAIVSLADLPATIVGRVRRRASVPGGVR